MNGSQTTVNSQTLIANQFPQEMSPIESTDRLSHVKMSDNLAFDELDESDEQIQPFRGDTGADGLAPNAMTGGAKHTVQTQSSTKFLPAVTKRTAILCNWVTNNWANRKTQSNQAIDLRECLPPMYHNAKNMAKTIKVSI